MCGTNVLIIKNIGRVPLMTKKILISGASVAGPALAYWLSRYGFDCTLVERAPVLRDGGYAVDFRGVSMEVLARMELLGEVENAQTRMGTVSLVDRANKRLADLPTGLTTGQVEIMRGDLSRILYEATRHDAEYIFGDSIVSMSQSEEGVCVTFRDGQSRMFDLVVGADGLHSNVRGLTFGDEVQFIRHMGCYVSSFTTSNHLNLDHAGSFYGVPGKVVGMFSARHNREATASFFYSSAPVEYDRYDVGQQKKIVADQFRDAGWEVPRLLDAMWGAPDFYFDSISQIKMDRWSMGRVVLLGDAAYCASPLSGMGTGMAMVGAYVLAGELKEACGDYTTAFTRYENLMRGYVAGCQRLAEGASDWFIPRTRLRGWMLIQMYRMLPYTPWKNLMSNVPIKAANGIVLKDYSRTIS
jgi:2-polyprenyl-6-methoxyphenol hydroxylase-like FAD-dependent oxidoreductase